MRNSCKIALLEDDGGNGGADAATKQAGKPDRESHVADIQRENAMQMPLALGEAGGVRHHERLARPRLAPEVSRREVFFGGDRPPSGGRGEVPSEKSGAWNRKGSPRLPPRPFPRTMADIEQHVD